MTKDLINTFIKRKKAPTLDPGRLWDSKCFSADGNIEITFYKDGTAQYQDYTTGKTLIVKGQQSVSIQVC